jgi:hypothetical protein
MAGSSAHIPAMPDAREAATQTLIVPPSSRRKVIRHEIATGKCRLFQRFSFVWLMLPVVGMFLKPNSRVHLRH